MDYKLLIEEAEKAKTKAYAPYSNFRVGAALLTEDGKIYTGGNIENASYGLTMCAERTAVYKAVLEGEKKFKAVAITSDSHDYISPCGACRQVLAELCGLDIDVIMLKNINDFKLVKLKELLPYSFTKDSL
ncbi:MAG: cytidine deaminase [Ignavibacteriae bacterium HGW-Ignavibacteriae-2]|jgi:cytidine deaminase|nr:MAG: cytidine deaminase [Ignavibacteriae bacterium HGW-Ignavibacteriae-2]